jgi:hypothetical protein
MYLYALHFVYISSYIWNTIFMEGYFCVSKLYGIPLIYVGIISSAL